LGIAARDRVDDGQMLFQQLIANSESPVELITIVEDAASQ
jgi:hypothetical protein